LSPLDPTKGDVRPMRRGEPRREVSDRVSLSRIEHDGRGDGQAFEGWALNLSRGGVRCILEEKVELGEEYEITIGVEGASPLTRRCRVVWLQEEADGVVVGVEFVTSSGTHRSVPPIADAPLAE